ncbi:MAG TPA: hypothetical protein PLF40_00830 [Kofleriaceae bacterium]|nr:hypothetical protein [Kofleriaceae bacterium]
MQARLTRFAAFGLVGIATVASNACNRETPCAGRALRPGEIAECTVPGWTDRGYTLHLPTAAQAAAGPRGVIISFHGGGGSRVGANRTSCPRGDTTSSACFASLANARGYAVVFPDGTGARPARNLRTWNAGGGEALACVSGAACRSGVDDIAYFDALLEQLQGLPQLDTEHLFLTGISNGAAMSHRIACERASMIRAIAPVAGTNQFAGDGGACADPVAVLQVHGTSDPCWPYEGGSQSCLENNGDKLAVAPSMEGWRSRNGCTAVTNDTLLNDIDPSDGTSVILQRWAGCRKATELLRIDGGGHTWPNGDPYLDEDRVGLVTHDVGSEQILQFFEDNRE